MMRATLVPVVIVLAGGGATFLLLPRFKTLRSQIVLLSMLAVVLPALSVISGGVLMLKRHEVIELSLIAVFAVIISAVIGLALGRRVGHHLSQFRDAATELADGHLEARIPEQGPLELRELAVSFNTMAEQLARLFETRRNLVAWASHDLRAPLAALQAMIEASEDGLMNPSDCLPAMRMQVRTLSSIVDDLFELSRIETGTLALAMCDVSISNLAGDCVDSFQAQARQRGISLHLVDASPGIVARCDPEKVERVLFNLLGNALRYTPKDGSVAVRIASSGRPDEAVTIAVEDSGDGIPEESIGDVFDSFWRADPSRNSETGGVGLGLAIARGLVEANGGRIWAENAPDGGARLTFSLPRPGDSDSA